MTLNLQVPTESGQAQLKDCKTPGTAAHSEQLRVPAVQGTLPVGLASGCNSDSSFVCSMLDMMSEASILTNKLKDMIEAVKKKTMYLKNCNVHFIKYNGKG